MRDQTTNIVPVYSKEEPVEEVGPFTFLSQSAAGGAGAIFVSLLAMALVLPSSWDFLFVILLPFYLLMGGLVGVITGLTIRLVGKALRRKLGITLRIIIAIAFLNLTTMVIGLFNGSGAESAIVLGLLVFCSVVGLVVGTVAGSSIKPWHIIAYGTAASRTRVRVLFRAGPIRISRDVQSPTFSLLAGMPLRATSLFALMTSVLTTACALSFFLWNWEPLDYYYENVMGAAIATAYFAVTVSVSFGVRQRTIVLVTAVLVNIPLSVWALAPTPRSAEADFLRAAALVFICLWSLFVGGQFADRPKEGELRVEYRPAGGEFAQPQLARST